MDTFLCVLRKQVQASTSEAEKDQVVVPTTMEEYCMKPKKNPAQSSAHLDNIEIDDFYDDDDCYDMLDDDDEDEEDEEEDEEEEEGEEGKKGHHHHGAASQQQQAGAAGSRKVR